MPRHPPDALQQRRDQILDAAVHCFVAKGIHATTMRDICQQAGISTGALYHHFPGKRELIQAFIARNNAQNKAGHERARQPEAPQPVRQIFRDSMLAALRDPGHRTRGVLNFDSVAESQRDPATAALLYPAWEESLDRLVDIIRQGQERGEVHRDDEPVALARLLLAQYIGLLALRLFDPDLDTDQLGELLLARLLPPLDPKAAP